MYPNPTEARNPPRANRPSPAHSRGNPLGRSDPGICFLPPAGPPLGGVASTPTPRPSSRGPTAPGGGPERKRLTVGARLRRLHPAIPIIGFGISDDPLAGPPERPRRLARAIPHAVELVALLDHRRLIRAGRVEAVRRPHIQHRAAGR